MITRELAKSLAIEYAAYVEASQNDDALGILVWGKMLLERQEEAGIMLAMPGNIRARVATAKIRYAQA